MLYQSLSIKGFGSHVKKETYDFPSGIVFITGKNGSGKSTILDAIQWVLYGPSGSSRTLKDRTSVINITQQSATVTLHLVHDVHGDVSITRTLTRSGKHSLSVSVEGVKLEKNIRDSQLWIQELLGKLPTDVFRSTYILESSPVHPPSTFVSAIPSQRRGILSSIVDPEGDFSSTNKVVKKALREEKKTHASLEGKVSALQETLDDITLPPDRTEDIESVENTIHELKKKLLTLGTPGGDADRIEVLKQDVVSLEKKIGNGEKTLAEIRHDISTCAKEKESAKRKLRDFLSEKNTLKKVADHIQAEASVAVFLRDELDRKIRNNNSAIRHYEIKKAHAHAFGDIYHGEDHCPLCGSEIAEPLDIPASDGSEYDTIIHSLTVGVEQFSKDLDDLDSRQQETMKNARRMETLAMDISSARAEADAISRDMGDLEVELSDMEGKLGIWLKQKTKTQDELSALTHDVSAGEDTTAAEYEETKKTVEKLTDSLISYKSDHELYKKEAARMDSVKSRLDDALYNLGRSERRKTQLENLDRQTSPNGDISDTIHKLMVKIGTKATELYQEFFDEDTVITLSDGEEGGERTCLIYCNDRDLGTYSHGEQLRVYCTLQLAMVVSVYKRTDMWIPPMWDEPSIAVDYDVVRDVFALPYSVIPEYHQFFIITRDDIPSEVDDDHVVALGCA